MSNAHRLISMGKSLLFGRD